jgi:hypothetical protein
MTAPRPHRVALTPARAAEAIAEEVKGGASTLKPSPPCSPP